MSPTPQQRDAILEAQGWTLECESPMELRHYPTGDFASGFAARTLLTELLNSNNSDTEITAQQRRATLPEFTELFDRIAFVSHLATSAAANPTSWKIAFNTAFSDSCTGRIHILLASLNIPFPSTQNLSPRGSNHLARLLNSLVLEHPELEHWEDPDQVFSWDEPATTYLTDLQTHANALQTLQKQISTALNLSY